LWEIYHMQFLFYYKSVNACTWWTSSLRKSDYRHCCTVPRT